MRQKERNHPDQRHELGLKKLKKSTLSSWCLVAVAAGALAGYLLLNDYSKVDAQSTCVGVSETYLNFNDYFLTLDESCTRFNMSDFWNRLTGGSDAATAIDAFGERQDLVQGPDGNLYLIAKGGNRIELQIPLTVTGKINIKRADGMIIEMTQDEILGVANQVATTMGGTPDVSSPLSVPVIVQPTESIVVDSIVPNTDTDESSVGSQLSPSDQTLYNLLDNPKTGMTLVCGTPLAMYLVGLFIYSKLSRKDEKYTSSTRTNQDQDYDKSARDAADAYIFMYSGSESDDRSIPPNPTPMRNTSTDQGQRSLPNTGIDEGAPVVNHDRAVGFPKTTMINDGLFEVLKEAGKAVEGIWWDVKD